MGTTDLLSMEARLVSDIPDDKAWQPEPHGMAFVPSSSRQAMTSRSYPSPGSR